MTDKALKAIWTDADTDILMDSLAKAAIDGRKGHGGFSEAVYQDTARLFPADKPKPWLACRNRYQKLKSLFRQVKELNDKSGFEWDPDQQCVTADRDVWEDLGEVITIYLCCVATI